MFFLVLFEAAIGVGVVGLVFVWLVVKWCIQAAKGVVMALEETRDLRD